MMTLLEYLRRSKGITQADLAGRAGCATKSIANLERGHWARPSEAFLKRLAVPLDVEPDRAGDLVGDVDPKRWAGAA